MCNCINAMNEQLKEHNGRLIVPMFTAPRVIITLEKLSPRKRVPVVVANYCPFCGETYPEEVPA